MVPNFDLWNLVYAIPQAMCLMVLLWLAREWIFNHEEVCQKCRTKHRLADLEAQMCRLAPEKGQSQ